MVRRASRTSSVRKLNRKTAKGTKRVYVKKAKKNVVSCSVCGKRKALGSGKVAIKRRPERPFAGILCHSCLDAALRYRVRLEDGSLDTVDVPKALLPFVV